MPGPGIDTRGAARRRLFDQPYLLLTITSLSFAGNTVFGRAIVGHVPPVTFAFVRWAGAFLILLPFAARHIARDWPTIRKHAGLLTVLALTGYSAYNTLAYYGLQYTSAINGALLASIAPLFVALWTFVLFGDRLTLRQAGGITVSLIGVVVIVSRGSPGVLMGIGLNRGDLWILAALVIYAYYTAAQRKRPQMHPLSFLAVGMGWGAVLLVPALIWELASGPAMTLDAVSIGGIVYVCLFPSLIGYLCLNHGLELIGANRAAPFLHLTPVFGSALAVLVLGERFALYHAAGYALAFTGVTLAARK